MKKEKLMVEVPTSLMEEINKFLAKNAKGKSLQGMKRTIVTTALHSLLLDRGWKISNGASKDCIEMANNARFQI